MPENGKKYADVGDDYEDSSPSQRRGGSPNDHTDSKSQHVSRGSSKSRERERENGREKERERDRGGDREKEREREKDRSSRRHRDRHEDRGGDRRERDRGGRDDVDDYHRSRSREFERHRDYDREREGRRHKHRSRSLSRERSSHRSQSRSRSRSKSKRISGFDMAPPSTTMLAAGVAAAAAAAGQISAATSIPGMLPNMLALTPGQATRHARRVYVGGLSPTANEQSVATFFSQVMSAIGGNTAGPGDSVVNVYINHDKKFAFVEMRSVEEASNAMALDGIIFEGGPVKVRRPTDYNPSLAAALGPSQPNPNLNLAAVGLTPGSAGGLEGPDRIFVGGLPYYFTEAQIRELLESFGPLRGFDLVKDRETGNSKGYAFCVYQDLSVTDIACAALNGIKMGDKTLTVRRANLGTTQPKPEQENVLIQAQLQVALQRQLFQTGGGLGGGNGGGLPPTKVVCLTEVVTADELKDDEEYEDILEDMRVEGGKFGTLMNIVIPRPQPNGEPSPGLGKVFMEYNDVEGSSKARAGLNGRRFGGNQVVAVFYPENQFAEGIYDA
ncbi:splicing factor U2af large subunit B-like isoform X2 [Papaver somniferum]|uniref:splicing factor U2af large subunit B-like isoform X2 n=2 Tax=Papaver somniferum TaxID=3469 RepID=UPI000E6F852C|nr:splicing factor U2af large subunit B-like isoform X2 [Papaver somniferum]